MIPRFSIEYYIQRLATLCVPGHFITAIRACMDDGLNGFESSSRSVSMLCHSIKMAMAMKIGSKLENAGRLSDEINSLVAGFYFKVGELVISLNNEEGKKYAVRHRPDALRLFTLPNEVPVDGFKPEEYIRFAEYKTWEFLENSFKKGDRYVFDKAMNRFRCPAAEQAAKEIFGFGYEVLTERDLDPVIVANGEKLSAYFDPGAKAASPSMVDRAREVTAMKQGIALSELRAAVPGLDMDYFYKLLVDQKLYVPLELCHLDLPTTVQVFTDRISFETFAALMPSHKPDKFSVRCRFPVFEPGELLTIRKRNYTVVAPSQEAVQFRDERGDSSVMTRKDLERLLKEKQISSLGVPVDPKDLARKILLSTPPHKLAPALQRLAILRPSLDGKRRAKGAFQSLANGKEWLRRARAAIVRFGNPLIGCIDNRDRQGWTGSHLVAESEALIAEVIETTYLTKQASKKSAAYGVYRNLCKERGRAPVSAKTFNARIARYTADKIARAREGAMAAAAQEAPVSEETLLAGGGRWLFHLAHLDEFILDLALIFPELGLALGSAWVAVMIDSYTRTVLALVVSFESPCYVTTMMLLRDCVARWGRLPEILFMDNGAGFKNLSVVLFAQYYNVQLCWRPPGMPRWGAHVERFAGAINQRLADELPGATKILNKFRRLSKSHHPEKLAIFGLQAIAEVLRDWCFTEYDSLPHAGLHGKTPAVMREMSQMEHGARLHLKVSDDPLFRILSLPAPEGDGTAKVQAHDGVQVDNLYYWHEKFHDPALIGSHVQLRYDPFDITRVYAYVVDEWVECSCIKLHKLRRLSDEDLCAASLDIRKGRSDYNRKQDSVKERVAEFLDGARKSGEQLAHLLRTKESARQFLGRTPPPHLGDDETSAPSESGAKTPPRIPGFTVSLSKKN